MKDLRYRLLSCAGYLVCENVCLCVQNLTKVKQIDDLMASSSWASLSDQDKKDVGSSRTQCTIAENFFFGKTLMSGLTKYNFILRYS